MKSLFTILFFLVGITANAQTYCSPSFSSGCAFSNHLSSVTVGGMSNTTSGCTVWNYTNKTASITAGDTIAMTVSVAGWDGIAVYVDLNNDGDMTDTNEFLYNHYIAQFASTYNFSITVPPGTSAGNHRFRVNCGNGGSVGGGNPCVSTSYGNFHDYTLAVTNNCPTDSNLTVSNITNSSADLNWEARNGTGYEYVLDTNSSSPMGSGTVTTSTSYSATGLTNGEHYFFHIRTSCGNGIFSPWGQVDFVACDVPDASINMSGNVNVCKGDTVALSVTFDSTYSYQWYLNGGKMNGKTSNTIDITVFSATYHALVETLPGCISVSDDASIKFNDKPDPPVISVNGFLLTTGGFASYLWRLNGNVIPGSIDSTHLAVLNGTYRVIGTDSNGCIVASETVEVIGVGIEDYSEVSGFRIYPNPVNDFLQIDFEQKLEKASIEISNAIGKTVYSAALSNSNSHLVNASQFTSGIYVVKVTSAGNSSFFKVIKN